MTKQEQRVLRQLIERHDFLEIIDEASTNDGFAVQDSREGVGVVIKHPDALQALVDNGGEWYCNSEFNGVGLWHGVKDAEIIAALDKGAECAHMVGADAAYEQIRAVLDKVAVKA
jgi:hypothetical protein